MPQPFRSECKPIYLRADYNAFSLKGNFTINPHYAVNKLFPKSLSRHLAAIPFRTAEHTLRDSNN